MDVLVGLLALFLLFALFSLLGSLFYAVETFGVIGIVYWGIIVCTGIGAFCAVTFGFIYWTNKLEKANKKAS